MSVADPNAILLTESPRSPHDHSAPITSGKVDSPSGSRSSDSLALFVSPYSSEAGNITLESGIGGRELKAKVLVEVAIPHTSNFDRSQYTLFDNVTGNPEEIERGRVKAVGEVGSQDSKDETVLLEDSRTLESSAEAPRSITRNPETEISEEDAVLNIRAPRSQSGRGDAGLDAVKAIHGSSEDEISSFTLSKPGRPRRILDISSENYSQSRRQFSLQDSEESESASELSGSSDDKLPRRSSRQRRQRLSNVKKAQSARPSSTRRSLRPRMNSFDYQIEDESSSDDGLMLLHSDVLPTSRKRKRILRGDQLATGKEPRLGTRRSGRSTRHQENMEEVAIDDIYRSASESDKTAAPPISSSVKEIFKPLQKDDPFKFRHVQGCDVCREGTPNANGPLVYCQGCILSYHRNCLGPRANREHLVTKINDGDFVLQCRRCVNHAQKREATAPVLAKCQICMEIGSSSVPFSDRKTSAQEQKEKEGNHGEDPIHPVDPSLINNPHNVLFRCLNCMRAFHFHHLPTRNPHLMDLDNKDEEVAEKRFHEYCMDWTCKDCLEMPSKVSKIIAWRPTDVENYPVGSSCATISDDKKEYLIKWENLSYFRATWMPGAWTWGVTAPTMRKAFYKREDGPKMRTEDAIPEEFLRIDIVLNIKFTSIVDIRTEEIDKARIKEVDEALIKYKGLGYEDAVWEKVPTPEDGDRWVDFVTAYNDWVLGRYIHCPKSGPLKSRLEKIRLQPFAKLEKKKQPENIVGGELMKYQIDGLNWLYYQWYSKKNGILADEMGLGKTIQAIAFMATLVQDHNCFPFLVVVPNSTCANWRREIKQWAPTLRVVTYFGSAAARQLAYRHEMFPEGSRDLRCHVVVTSYDTAADESSRRVFKGVNWVGLIVDEGQRLKSDKSVLYSALSTLKVPFRLLLTGTPLQNNARELFNLLQFLDEGIDATALEAQYADITKEKIPELHGLIRPYILRRTKAQVLTFLPPMAQIIIPLSMSILQKKLYKSILSKNPEVLRALFTTNHSLKPQERASLNNVLMQLRKCLCHPFVYSKEIEERTEVAAVSHRNLVEASSKLQLLEILLPKLRERGHRVLIFSQFLDMLDIIEDFLDGLQMSYQRLDGSMGSLEKQKRIDEFNAPESPLFAFLLSTRAGGVGINLATADTVIILDPDFNPHQDIQALSRAHRIGQKKKVLCFQLMTRASAEEKIVQIGRKKIALDHVVVEQLDAEDMDERDVESILKHGASELFSESDVDQDIRYDSASVDKLLDRSQIENTKSGNDQSAESQFSFARVWENTDGGLQESLVIAEEEEAPDPTVWDKILKERERVAAAEAALLHQTLGRGKRARLTVDYGIGNAEGPDSPVKSRGRRRNHDSDTDFQAESTDFAESDGEATTQVQDEDLEELNIRKPQGIVGAELDRKPINKAARGFNRVSLSPLPVLLPTHINGTNGNLRNCPACNRQHPVGSCPLKVAGVEYCPLCDQAHYGIGRVCPHINSETQVREMIETLKLSPEPSHLVEAALKYLKGVKGHLVAKKKKEKVIALAARQGAQATGQSPAPNNGPSNLSGSNAPGTNAMNVPKPAALGPPSDAANPTTAKSNNIPAPVALASHSSDNVTVAPNSTSHTASAPFLPDSYSVISNSTIPSAPAPRVSDSHSATPNRTSHNASAAANPPSTTPPGSPPNLIRPYADDLGSNFSSEEQKVAGALLEFLHGHNQDSSRPQIPM